MVRSILSFRLPAALFGVALTVTGLAAAPAAADGRLVVREFVLTHGIVGREPTNDTSAFTVHDKKIYAFARINNTGAATAVNVIWTYQGARHGSVWLNVGKSPAWRTWSSANLKPGNWSVSLIDADGSIMVQRSFTVGPMADAMAATDDMGDMDSASYADDVGGFGDEMVAVPASTSTIVESDGSMFYPMR